MLFLISIMMGAYFIARLVSLCTRTGEREEHEATKVLSFVAIIAVCVCVYLIYKTANDFDQKSAATEKLLQQQFQPR